MGRLINFKVEKLVRDAQDCVLYIGNHGAALNLLDKALKIDPHHKSALMLSGNVSLSMGNLDRALEFFKLANDLYPDNAKILGSIAICYEMSQYLYEALFYCEKAFSVMEERYSEIYPSLYELKISLLIKLGNFESASAELKNSGFYLLSEDLEQLRIIYQGLINRKIKMKSKIESTGLKLIKGA